MAQHAHILPGESFALQPQSIIRHRTLSAHAKNLFAEILLHLPAADGWRYIAVSTLAEAQKLGSRRIQQLTRELSEAGVLLKEGDGARGQPGRYRPCPIPENAEKFQGTGEIPLHPKRVDNSDISNGEFRVDNSRARNAHAGNAAVEKQERFRLSTQFVPADGWEPWLIEARQARIEKGIPPLPITEARFISKFLEKCAAKGKAQDQTFWKRDFIRWYVTEKPPKTEAAVTPTYRAAPKEPAPIVAPPALPPTAAPPPSTINDLIAALQRSKTLAMNPRATAAPCVVSPEVEFKPNPEFRARAALELQEQGFTLPKNCNVIGI